jgi:transposase
MSRKRREFDADYKAEAIRLTKVGDRSISQVAKDLDLTETALRRWIDQSVAAGGPPGEGPLTSAERQELRRLRRENKVLQMEKEILKKATAFFAKESK